MNMVIESTAILPDSAAVFATALSLWKACQKHAAAKPELNFSEAYHGMDQFMREIMRVANQFEEWACRHIDFNKLDQTWPYLLADGFGDTCLQVLSPAYLTLFETDDCLRVALRLRLPVKWDTGLPVPVDVSVANPFYVPGSTFRAFRIQSVRDAIEGNDCVPFTVFDDPFDAAFGLPFFGFYGIGDDGLLEHIADRQTFPEAMRLARKLGVDFGGAGI